MFGAKHTSCGQNCYTGSSIEKIRPQAVFWLHVDIFDIKFGDALLVQFFDRHTNLDQFRDHGKRLLLFRSCVLYPFHFLLSHSWLLCMVSDIMRKPGVHLSDDHHTNWGKTRGRCTPLIGVSGYAA